MVENRIVLAWHDQVGRGHLAGRLANIGQTGALVVTEAVPPAGSTVSIRLIQPSDSVWIEAQVVSSTPRLRTRLMSQGPCTVQVRFLVACPYDAFKPATHGPWFGQEFHEPEPSEFERGVWR